MNSLQLKPLVSLLTLLTVVGCASTPKTSSPVSLPTVELASVVGSAEQGAVVQLPAGNTLGVSSVIVDRTYFAASGLECRRLTHVDGTPIQRVACKDDSGVWRFSRDLSTSSIGGSTSFASNSVPSKPLSLNADISVKELSGTEGLTTEHLATKPSQVEQSNTESLFADSARTTDVVIEQEALVSVGSDDVVIGSAIIDTTDDVAIGSEIIDTTSDVVLGSEVIDTTGDVVLEAEVTKIADALGSLSETVVEVPASFDKSTNSDEYEITDWDLYNDEAKPTAVASNETLTFDVKINETLWSFAKRTTGNALNWEAIATSNGISNAKSLTSGSVLNVPAELVRRGE